MKSYEIFREMNPETALSVFQFLRDEQREVYTASLSSLAANRKLRPVFLQRKPGRDQVAWMAKNVKLKGSEEVAEQVLQLWLLKAHADLLIAFLEGLDIEHDGEGAAEDIPDTIDSDKLASTVDQLLQDHDPETVAIYLHTFQLQRVGGWPEISNLIAATPALQLVEPVEPEPESKTEPEAVEPEPTTEPVAEAKNDVPAAEEKPESSEEPKEDSSPPAKKSTKKKAPAKKSSAKKAGSKKAAKKKDA